ncbi:MAG: protein kinase [Deltaproteobacteria bacterium]|nr:protein kinase [Deltaproteobacteria bacterium]
MAEIQTYGEYYLTKKIATGGMAELYRARKISLEGFEKILAVKRILPQFCQDQEFITMFIDEAKLAAQLNHQNIVQIYDMGKVAGTYFIAMEFILGHDLWSIVKTGIQNKTSLGKSNILFIISQVCRALQYAHFKKDRQNEPLNIVHRDISPQNVLISNEGDVKLVDFGIAKAASRSNQTQAGLIKGKLAYMSPEQALGKPLDHRSDIFSLGTVMYELLTQRRLFYGGSEVEVLEKVRKCAVYPPSRLNREIDQTLEAIIFKALARDREERFQNAEAMQKTIEAYLFSAQQATPPSTLTLREYIHEMYGAEIEQEENAIRAELETVSKYEKFVAPKMNKTIAHQALQTEAGNPEMATTRVVIVTEQSSGDKLPVSRRVLVLMGVLVILAVAYLFGPISKGPTPTREQKAVPRPAASTAKSGTQKPKAPSAKIDTVRPDSAIAALKAEDFTGAQEKFQQWFAGHPQDKDKYALDHAKTIIGATISQALTLDPVKRTNRYQEVVNTLESMLQKDPNDPNLYYELGRAATGANNFPKAISALQKSISFRHDFFEAHMQLAEIYFLMNNYKQSNTELLQLKPKDSAQAAWLETNLGINYYLLRDHQRAVEYLRRAMENDPGNNKLKVLLTELESRQK